MPSPPPVSFLLASATEYSCPTWYCGDMVRKHAALNNTDKSCGHFPVHSFVHWSFSCIYVHRFLLNVIGIRGKMILRPVGKSHGSGSFSYFVLSKHGWPTLCTETERSAPGLQLTDSSCLRCSSICTKANARFSYDKNYQITVVSSGTTSKDHRQLHSRFSVSFRSIIALKCKTVYPLGTIKKFKRTTLILPAAATPNNPTSKSYCKN